MKQPLLVLGLASFVAVILAFSLGQNVESQSNRIEIYTADDTDALINVLSARIDTLEQRVAALEAQNVTFEDRLTLLESVAVEVETPTGLYLPWYSFEMRTKGVELASAYPDSHFLFTVNPASGPGTSPRSDIQSSIDSVKAANENAVILAYIPTDYGNRPIADIKNDVDLYVQFYNDLDGVMWDETSNDITHLTFYTEITDYARSQGLEKVRANPGVTVPAEFVDIFDIISIHEAGFALSESELAERVKHGQKQQFNYILHSQSDFDKEHYEMVKQYVGSVYITNEAMPNPYAVPTEYLADMLN